MQTNHLVRRFDLKILSSNWESKMNVFRRKKNGCCADFEKIKKWILDLKWVEFFWIQDDVSNIPLNLNNETTQMSCKKGYKSPKN